MYAHLTTVHARNDTRIHGKELGTLRRELRTPGLLVVADGGGDRDGPGGDAVIDLGRIGHRGGRALLGSLRALRLLRRVRPALVHFHDPELIPLALVLKLMGLRVIYDAHEDVPRQILGKHWIPGGLRRSAAAAMELLEWLAGRSLDAVVAATPVIASRFPAAKQVLVPNFPIPEELLAGGALEVSRRGPEFLYVGGVAAIRGAVEMVRAVERLGDVPGVRLHIAGTMDQPELAQRLAALPAWGEAVRYHGFVDRAGVAALLGRARAGLVLLHPLRNYVDAWPIKMFEYMAAGIPVIASDFPIWRDIVERTGCGLLVDPLDTGAIADAMRWIIERPAEAERMGERGREAVLNQYNWSEAGGRLVALYHRLGVR